MYSKLALFVASAVALGVVAAPGGTPPGTSQCDGGSVQCCNSVEDASSGSLASIFALLGLNVQGVTGQVGVNCIPVIGGNSCSAQTTCCTGNSFNGLIVVGCSPVNVGL